VSFHLSYEVVSEQNAPGQASRIVKVAAECDAESLSEAQEAISAFLTAVTGEREMAFRLALELE
jgi:hypothetical protein